MISVLYLIDELTLWPWFADFDVRFLVAHSFLGKADVYWDKHVINGCAWAGSILPVSSVPVCCWINTDSSVQTVLLHQGGLLQGLVESERCQQGPHEKAVLFRRPKFYSNNIPTIPLMAFHACCSRFPFPCSLAIRAEPPVLAIAEIQHLVAEPTLSQPLASPRTAFRSLQIID